jgi:hypothetical protein
VVDYGSLGTNARVKQWDNPSYTPTMKKIFVMETERTVSSQKGSEQKRRCLLFAVRRGSCFSLVVFARIIVVDVVLMIECWSCFFGSKKVMSKTCSSKGPNRSSPWYQIYKK